MVSTQQRNKRVSLNLSHKSTQHKLAQQKARLVFLLKCRRHNVFPNFILHRTAKLKSNSDCVKVRQITRLAIEELNRKLLNAQIADCCFMIKRLYKKENVTNDDNQQYKTALKYNNHRLYRKFNQLLQKQNTIDDIKYDDSFIKNCSGVNIPKEMTILLGLGPKFALPTLELPALDLIADIEYIISRHAAEPIKKVMRSHLTHVITNWSKRTKKLDRIQRFLIKAARITAKFLRDNRDIFVSNSDKGNVTIIARRSDYDSKMGELVSNQDNFEELSKDPTEYLQNKNNRLIGTLYNKHRQFITQKQSLSLRTHNAVPPRIYGQFKFHKEGMPIRPIISTINSPCCNYPNFWLIC